MAENSLEYFVNVYIMTDNFNVPAHINKVLNKESTNNSKYAFFLQNDIFANLIDKDKIFVESKKSLFLQRYMRGKETSSYRTWYLLLV